MDEQKIRAFFIAYESRVNAALAGSVDIDGTIQSFAACFIEASPLGVQCGNNDTSFREAIPKGYEFYRSIGTTAMKITAMDITPLDEWHAMAKIYWQAFYTKKDNSKEVVEFTVIYFVQTLNDQVKVFAYITGDEQKVLKERGLIPE